MQRDFIGGEQGRMVRPMNGCSRYPEMHKEEMSKTNTKPEIDIALKRLGIYVHELRETLDLLESDGEVSEKRELAEQVPHSCVAGVRLATAVFEFSRAKIWEELFG